MTTIDWSSLLFDLHAADARLAAAQQRLPRSHVLRSDLLSARSTLGNLIREVEKGRRDQ